MLYLGAFGVFFFSFYNVDMVGWGRGDESPVSNNDKISDLVVIHVCSYIFLLYLNN